MPMPHVTIYTDGGCRPNPGPGGWAALLIYSKHERELVGSKPHSTNNRMELRAAIEALRALKEPCQVDLYTDSQYLHQGITSWLPKWVKNGWRTCARRPVKNQDLWQELHAAMQRHEVRWRWVRGHAGDARNTRVDRLARQAIGRAAGQGSK